MFDSVRAKGNLHSTSLFLANEAIAFVLKTEISLGLRLVIKVFSLKFLFGRTNDHFVDIYILWLSNRIGNYTGDRIGINCY